MGNGEWGIGNDEWWMGNGESLWRRDNAQNKQARWLRWITKTKMCLRHALWRALFFSFCAERNEARKGFACALAMYLLAVLYIHTYISVWRVRKHETQSYRESCVFHFSHFEIHIYIYMWEFDPDSSSIILNVISFSFSFRFSISRSSVTFSFLRTARCKYCQHLE